MKANTPKSNVLTNFLSKIPIDKIAKESNFSKRKPKKSTPKSIILGFFLMIVNGEQHSFQNWASKIGLLNKLTISKQALWKRMNNELIVFLEKVLSRSLALSMKNNKIQNLSKKLKGFKNILIEDSTHIKLDDRLANHYPGNGYWDLKAKKAVMKINTIYNVSKARFESFLITNFRMSDSKCATNILDIAKKGDLILRDLGFYSIRIFREIMDRGVYFISRMKTGTNLYQNQDDLKAIDLAKMLRKRGELQGTFYLGKEDRVPVRIIALPVDEAVANERRRKARIDRDRRNVPSKERMFLLGWEIFITNVKKEVLSPADIAALYFARWRIEILFKCWKSYLKINRVPKDGNLIRLRAFIYCYLIFIVLVQVNAYQYYLNMKDQRRGSNGKGEISIVKLTKYIAENIHLFIEIQRRYWTDKWKLIDQQIQYYCCYESRNDRSNFAQKIGILG